MTAKPTHPPHTDDRPAPEGRPKAVVLLSGGLDSTVAAAIAKADGFEVHALTVRYGQRHAVEVDASRRVATALGVASHRVVDLDLRAIGGSALTDDLAVPRADSDPTAAIPITYVPARNTIFLGLALGHAEVLGAQDIYIGVSSVDFSGYPDCRPAFVEAFERLAQVATKAGVEGAAFRIHAPLQHLTKAETIRRGLELGVDFALTHTCYDPAPDGAACGACESCRLRRAAFEAAGVPDPTRYAGASPSTTIRILELYRTLQGETSFVGMPCIIVRLAGCPLRCSYCDTAYARETQGMELSIEEVVRSMRDLGPGLVAVTGGEPLAQPGVHALLRALADDGRTVLLETSGAFDVSAVDPRVRRIIDIKTPGSGMADKNLPGNLAVLRPLDELKFVLVDRADYEWSRELVRQERLDARCTVLFSPVQGKLDPGEVGKWIIADRLPVRLQIQLHRILSIR